MCFLYKKSIQRWGFLLMIFYFLIGMGTLIYGCSADNSINSRYFPNQFKGALNGNISVSVIFFIFSIIGIIAFYNESKVLLFFYGIVHSIIILFTFIMSIISLKINTNSSILKNYPCNKTVYSTNYSHDTIDGYLIEVDKILCSNYCPCKIDKTTNLSNLPISFNYSNNGSVNFQNCSDYAKGLAFANSNVTETILNFGSSNSNLTFNFDLFSSTWALIESKFECSGFCTVNYTDAKGNIISMNKYLFTDINNGVPQNKGCEYSMTKNVTKYFGIYGGLIIFIFFTQMLISFCACSFCCGKEEFKYETIYSINTNKIESRL